MEVKSPAGIGGVRRGHGSPVKIAVGIVLFVRDVRIEIVVRGTENQARSSQNPAVSAQVAAEYGERISLFPQHPGCERIFPCRHPVIRRIGFIGHFSEEFAVQPDPGEIVDDAEARTELKRFLRAEGKDDGTSGLRNLASTARLDLILEQNARMAAAVGQYQVGMDPDIRERFPCWRYIGSTALNPRDSHARFAGKVFRKDDPIWHKIFPPSDFNCKCSVEDCDDEPDRAPETIEPPESGFAFDPAHAFEEFDLSSVKSPESRGNIREAAEIEFGDQVSFKGCMAMLTQKPYMTFADEGLPSAKEWTAVPSPKRILPETARKRLEAGFEVIAGDGRNVVMDRAVLEHWTVENNKLTSDVESRLACLDYAIATLEKPCERWDQETQSRYLKKFQKTTGGFEGCMVVVTKDGKCRTYFLPNVTKLDKSRTGISYEVIGKVESSTGRSATQTTEAKAAPNRSDDRKDNNTPQ